MPHSPKHSTKQFPQNSRQTIGFFVFVVTATLLSLAYFSMDIRPSTVPMAPELIHAVAVLLGDSGVNGTVHFTQSMPLGKVKITGEIHGLDKNSLRGFHIHEYGDISSGCASTGGHFNPTSATHGGPKDTIRHVGDLGNIKSDKHGVATLDFEDSVISLTGIWSIVGRGLVVHTSTDDLGRGDNDDSNKTGNAGGRAACGVIGLAPTSD